VVLLLTRGETGTAQANPKITGGGKLDK